MTRAKADNPLHHAFLEAGVQAGYTSTDDFCGAQMEGFGVYDYTISKGVRARYKSVVYVIGTFFFDKLMFV